MHRISIVFVILLAGMRIGAVSADSLPSVEIIKPPDKATLAGSEVTIKLNLKRGERALKRVEFFLNDKKAGIDSGPFRDQDELMVDYTFNTKLFSDGEYRLTVRVLDEADGKSEQTITVVIKNR